MTPFTLRYRALVAAAALALALGPAPVRADDPACPAGHLLRVDVAAWAKAVRGARTIKALDAALARIGLIGVNGDPDGDVCEPQEQEVGRLKVDDFRPRLADSGQPAHVVQVLATVCRSSSESWQVQRGAVLVPRADGALCRVDAPFLNHTGSGYGFMLCDPTVFAFENVTSGDHVAMKVTELQSWCGTSGSDRGHEAQVSYWELSGAGLARLLQVTTSRAYYHSPTPPITSFETKLRIPKGPFPRPIQLTEVTTCDDPGEEVEESVRREFEECHAGRVKRDCRYDGSAYVCQPPLSSGR